MELFKRPDGRSPYWFVDYTDPQTGRRQRRSLGTANKTEAMQKALALVEAGGRHRLTLKAALDSYLETLSGKASHGESSRMAAKALGSLVGRFGMAPGMDIATLDTAACSRLVEARKREGNSNQTIAHELKLLRAAVRYAAASGAIVNRDMIDGSRSNAWRMPSLTMKTRYLTVEEFQRVHAALEPGRIFDAARGGRSFRFRFSPETLVHRQRQDAQDLLVALTMCGGRWSEVSSLRWDRIDLERRSIRLFGSKTQKERLVPMPDIMRSMLERRHAERLAGQDLVFPTISGKQRSKACQAIRKALASAGCNTPDIVGEMGRATIHSLRHTFASLLLQRGASLADIQHALGHRNLTMTMRYAHLLQGESVAKLAGIMNETIGGQ